MMNALVTKFIQKKKRTDLPVFRPGDTVRVHVKIKEGDKERLQAFESVLELPGSLQRYVRVPRPDQMPPGPLAREKIDTEIVRRGLLPSESLEAAPWTGGRRRLAGTWIGRDGSS